VEAHLVIILTKLEILCSIWREGFTVFHAVQTEWKGPRMCI